MLVCTALGLTTKKKMRCHFVSLGRNIAAVLLLPTGVSWLRDIHLLHEVEMI